MVVEGESIRRPLDLQSPLLLASCQESKWRMLGKLLSLHRTLTEGYFEVVKIDKDVKVELCIMLWPLLCEMKTRIKIFNSGDVCCFEQKCWSS